MPELFGNVANTTVTSGGATTPAPGTQETWTVSSLGTFPVVSSSASPPTWLHITDITADTELVQVLNMSGAGNLTWTVVRGAEGTTPVTHTDPFTVYQVTSAGYQNSVLAGVLQPSGDATGATDTANVNAAITAIGSSCGRILLAPGTFYWTCGSVVVTNPGVYIYGAGRWATIISAVGTGDTFRAYTTANYASGGGGPAGGCLKGLTFDGTNAGAGSSGAHIGDLYNYDADFGSRHFQGAGSKAIWFDNNYTVNGMEQLAGRVWAETSTTCVQFDCNPAIGYSTTTGSFDRACLDIFLDGKGKGNLVVLAGGAFLVDPDIGLYGNTDYGSALYYCLTVTGSNSGTYSSIGPGTLKIGVECNGTSGTQPGTINFGTAGPNGNFIQGCTGIIDFSGNNPFAGANNATENFQFDGPVYGDGFLHRTTGIGAAPYQAGAITSGSTIVTRYTSATRVTPASDVTGVVLSGFDPLSGQVFWLVNDSAYTVTFAAKATSNVMGGTGVIVQPDTAMQFLWNDNETAWFPVNQPAAVSQLVLAPSGATGQTADRQICSAYLSGLASGTVYCSAIPLQAGLQVNAITLVVGGTAWTLADVTHGWYALLDSGLVVRAVSADQASGNWGSTFTAVTLSVAASAYTTTYSGLYYAAFCATFTGSSGEFPAIGNPVGGLLGDAPVLASTSSTGQTTPPATGTTLAALSGTIPTAARFYAYTS